MGCRLKASGKIEIRYVIFTEYNPKITSALSDNDIARKFLIAPRII